jgi:putative spermidine/putrescine transport system permease protein
MRFVRFAPWLWLSPVGAVFIPFFAIPLIIILRNSLFHDDPFGTIVPDLTAANYVKVLSDPYYLGVFVHTMVAAFGITILALIVAYPSSWAIARAVGRTRTVLLWAVYLPIYVSVIMRVFGWIVFIADSGMINRALLSSGLIHEPIRMINEVTGMTIGLAHRYLPFMILPLVTAMRKVDDTMLRASQNLGAGRKLTWWRVVLPISLPGAVAGAQLVFAGVLSDYVIPMLMGTPSYQLMAPAIYYEATTNSSWALAGAMAALVMLLVGSFLLAANMALRRLAPWTSL